MLHQKADFIHVSGNQDSRTLAFALAEYRAQLVRRELSKTFELFDKDRTNLVLMSRDRMGLGEFLEQLHGVFFHGLNMASVKSASKRDFSAFFLGLRP